MDTIAFAVTEAKPLGSDELRQRVFDPIVARISQLSRGQIDMAFYNLREDWKARKMQDRELPNETFVIRVSPRPLVTCKSQLRQTEGDHSRRWAFQQPLPLLRVSEAISYNSPTSIT